MLDNYVLTWILLVIFWKFHLDNLLFVQDLYVPNGNWAPWR